MEKIIFAVLILGFVVAAVGAVGYFVFSQSESESPEQNNDNLSVINNQPLEPTPNPEPEPEPKPEPEPPLNMLLLEQEQTIPFEECSSRGLDDKVVVLVSKYCSACKIVVPILKEIEQELNTKFLYFDLSNKDDLEKFEEFKIQAQWTPTVIIGCEVLIGGYSKEKYKATIENL